MRVGIAIDVSTDVSPEFVADNHIHVLPSTIHMGSKAVVYDRDPVKGLAFYRELPALGVDTETTPFSVKEIEQLFLQRLVLDYDYIFLITLTGTRSQTYQNAHKASYTILKSYNEVRRAQRVPGAFALRVVDSQSLFTGPGVLAWEMVRMLKAGRSPLEIRERMDELIPYLFAYLIPKDLHYARAHIKKRKDKSVSLLSYLVGSALDIKPIIKVHCADTQTVAQARHHGNAVERLFLHCAERIRHGLLIPMIGISYGGDPALVAQMPGYADLAAAAAASGVELMVSMMAPAGAVNVGGEAVTAAYCAADAGDFA